MEQRATRFVGGTEEGYRELEREFGVDRYVIARLQRIGALPADVGEFSSNECYFLEIYKKLFRLPEYAKVQLKLLNRQKRLHLIESADDYVYHQWERWLITRLTDMYLDRMTNEDPSETAEKLKKQRVAIYRKILWELREYISINVEVKKRRIAELRKIAFRRAQRKFEYIG